MRIDIDRHAMQFHARDRRSYRIDDLLALLIDVVEQLILLRVPEQAAQHRIERGIFELLGCEGVSRPIGSAKLLGYRDARS